MLILIHKSIAVLPAKIPNVLKPMTLIVFMLSKKIKTMNYIIVYLLHIYKNSLLAPNYPVSFLQAITFFF